MPKLASAANLCPDSGAYSSRWTHRPQRPARSPWPHRSRCAGGLIRRLTRTDSELDALMVFDGEMREELAALDEEIRQERSEEIMARTVERGRKRQQSDR